MKVQELLNERAIQTLLHTTGVKEAISIIQSHQFKLSFRDETGDSFASLNGQDAPGEIEYYYLSTARSSQSAYFDDMMTEANVILVLSGTKLAQRYKMGPYSSPEAKSEMGHDYNEMEERVYSKQPILPIQGPINQTILAVHCMNLMDAEIYNNIRNQHVKRRASPAMMSQLWSLCRENRIRMVQYEDMERFRLMRQ